MLTDGRRCSRGSSPGSPCTQPPLTLFYPLFSKLLMTANPPVELSSTWLCCQRSTHTDARRSGLWEAGSVTRPTSQVRHCSRVTCWEAAKPGEARGPEILAASVSPPPPPSSRSWGPRRRVDGCPAAAVTDAHRRASHNRSSPLTVLRTGVQNQGVGGSHSPRGSGGGGSLQPLPASSAPALPPSPYPSSGFSASKARTHVTAFRAHPGAQGDHLAPRS